MPSQLYNENNVVVGAASLNLAPWLPPPGVLATPPLDTVALFAAYLAPWVNIGATNDGFKANVATSVNDVTIEEQATPVAQTVTAKKVGITAALSEDSLESIRLSWGGGTINTVVASSGVAPKRTMALADTVQYYSAVLEMSNQAGLARRIYIPKVSITGSGDVAFRRAAGPRLHPIAISSVCKPSDIVITDITGAPLP